MSDPRYPVGKYERRDVLTEDERAAMIEQIAATPQKLREAVAGLTPQQLETPYREGGWTLRQVVHHIPDSHMNSYVRFKLALTETTPTIRPYDEARWAELPDSVDTPPETSMQLLESLHDRWVRLLRSMSTDDFRRTLSHPENGLMTLDAMVALYAWHGRHHVAHITATRERNGW
ncbi:MAG TPA: bacillithiol transferase BstA [Thermoanaerobaculia bacterium]|nr:bacillithiol transferase BstA [Thermoanaerobaculia bacterium]